MKSTADLRKELELAEAREREAAKARKEATLPKFEFWVTPVPFGDDPNWSFGKLYDPTCHLYAVERRCVNREDARAVGWDEIELKEGSATYLYNTVTRRIVCAVGGGTVYVASSKLSGANDFADDTAFFEIGEYLARYPGGGEITWIYETYRAERKAASSNSNKTVTA